ncbi:pyroglutamyl-peptidase I [Anaerobacillus isosaccharinicus]|uniref:Pyroglutamyl-peptidase I n=1 Tax=Anaerobacillus isosaccharinicus TaxID=1532552 RepID=A0A1S2LFW8_9BACI|nr:pyroglutamyl-peptidase I [Anaerobacillus isosaccharinicus]MBA5587775.1 pyroglutamyl-peptidase I [Anaerobacillus isosaccharinicus]QOY34067.1 pyroglutamyl-peptidase I [Anaerobacillus isosaccharinicus]
MKILVTGFEPFGGMEVNPTSALVKSLQEETLVGFEIHSCTLPVVYDHCVQTLITKINEVNPDVVICCGLAFGRGSITIERIGINVKDTAGEGLKGDNQGEKPVDEKIIPDGPDGIFSTIPIRTMVNELVKNGIPAKVSNTAGTYICNNTLYGVLNFISLNKRQIKAGFVHFPATPEMTVEKPNVPSMSFETQLNSLRIIVKSLK